MAYLKPITVPDPSEVRRSFGIGQAVGQRGVAGLVGHHLHLAPGLQLADEPGDEVGADVGRQAVQHAGAGNGIVLAGGGDGHDRREVDVLRLIAQGLNNKAIAASLYISENTVKNHVRSIHEKLQVHSRMEAVVQAVREGLLEVG